MTSAGKWVLGCGAGCAALVILGIALAVGGTAWLAREATQPMEQAVETRTELEARFGAIDAYTPPPGLVDAARIEAFLRVRDRTAGIRDSVEQRFRAMAITPESAREMEEKGFLESMRTAWGMTKSGFALGPELGRFFEARNQALLDEQMGFGEYTWLYALTYWAYLGKSPESSLSDAEEFAGAPEERRPVGFDSLGFVSMPRVKGDLRGMVRRAAEAFPGDPALREERDRLEEDPRRVPWQDGVPDEAAAVLDPYRERLEADWTAATNSLELAINRKTGRMSFTLE